MGLFNYPKRKLRKLAKNGDYKEAIEFGKSIEKKFDQDPDFLFIMGSIFYILEDAKTSLSYFERVLSINPNDIETLLLKSNIQIFLQNKELATQCLNKIIELDPEHQEAKLLLEKISHNH
ncbi:hypothetical protein C6988_04710 [Nitrosopumilus sp. b1]|uniref:tetratricopeptide repeat protein n=1 Tax=Nitrosopumilus sp. b1 TaxID=2109907 RepID=UPI0015F4F2DE|nr:tetratricopeptide repeat protein [Nitrosopumilus sp. b1]KAF6243229.1 hypothetical protein C6988_04710 [Nitrosopumilus sp. b1]